MQNLQLVNTPINFEIFENFPKQTYRNRATIASPNGPLDLIIPVVRGSKLTGKPKGIHTLIKDVKISSEFKWQRLHWRSLESCYRSSAYFEYYEAELLKFYTKEYTFLVDFNIDLFEWILQKLKIKLPIVLSESYEDKDVQDFRSSFLVKDNEQDIVNKSYFQVFDSKNGFLPNLSIVDLLFNQGPQTLKYF